MQNPGCFASPLIRFRSIPYGRDEVIARLAGDDNEDRRKIELPSRSQELSQRAGADDSDSSRPFCNRLHFRTLWIILIASDPWRELVRIPSTVPPAPLGRRCASHRGDGSALLGKSHQDHTEVRSDSLGGKRMPKRSVSLKPCGARSLRRSKLDVIHKAVRIAAKFRQAFAKIVGA